MPDVLDGIVQKHCKKSIDSFYSNIFQINTYRKVYRLKSLEDAPDDKVTAKHSKNSTDSCTYT